MARLEELVPSADAEVWAKPDEVNFPEVEFLLMVVDAKKIDIISIQSRRKLRQRNEKGKTEVEVEFSNELAAKAYAREVFKDFRGIEDNDGKPLENTYENRVLILTHSQSFLNFVVDFAHSESNYVKERKKKEESDFLKPLKDSSKST